MCYLISLRTVWDESPNDIEKRITKSIDLSDRMNHCLNNLSFNMKKKSELFMCLNELPI